MKTKTTSKECSEDRNDQSKKRSKWSEGTRERKGKNETIKKEIQTEWKSTKDGSSGKQGTKFLSVLFCLCTWFKSLGTLALRPRSGKPFPVFVERAVRHSCIYVSSELVRFQIDIGHGTCRRDRFFLVIIYHSKRLFKKINK